MRKSGFSHLVVFTFLFGGVFLSVFSETNEPYSSDLSDIKKIKHRLYQYSLENPDVQAVKSQMETLRPDGSWADINYQDKRKAGWEPLLHLRRLLSMAQAYRNPDSALYSNSALKDKTLSALDFWLDRKIKGSSSWYNLIGIPKTLGPVLLLLEEELTAEQMEGGLYVMDFEVRYKKWKKQEHLKYWWNDGEAAGQNKLWMIRVNLFTALLRNQVGEIANCFASVEEEMTVDRPQLRDVNKGNEGIQADYSFHQHGPQLYSGGYGMGFALDAAYFLSLSCGTQFEFASEKQDFILGYILDGQQWMTYRGMFDYSAMGREISRQGISDKADQMLSVSEYLSGLDLSRRQELDAFFQRLRSGSAQPALTGHRHFWCSDFSVHRRSDYYVSVKMNSTRTLGTEMGNGEGLQNFYLADGCTLFSLTGKEYCDIFPVWDWTRIPGVTCEFTGSPPELEPWGNLNGVEPARRGSSGFVGGVSDGMYGLAAMDYQSAGVAARKAWFCFEKEIVCLGAGITCATTNSVITSVNQCRLMDCDVLVDGVIAEKGFRSLENARAVFHNGVGYLFPEPVVIRLKAEEQSGSWKSINRRYSSDSETKDVFSLWIEHGVRPENQTYSYLVVPNADPVGLPTYMEHSRVEILSNTPQIQAVCNRTLDITQAVFYEQATLCVDSATSVQVDQPCLLMITRDEGQLKICAANPENQAMELNVKIIKLQTEEGGSSEKAIQVEFNLPDGSSAGKTMVKQIAL